jgi:hypothetical protein
VVKEIAFEGLKTVVIPGVSLVTWTQPANPGQKPPGNRDPIEPFFEKEQPFFPPAMRWRRVRI